MTSLDSTDTYSIFRKTAIIITFIIFPLREAYSQAKSINLFKSKHSQLYLDSLFILYFNSV